ncbi:hypothetical protein KDW10_28935 [Burkholderia vietnamiensis]|uniref:hypothetical protein n=1 Tax=Burkholderia vietnamiensis TaxID=60552 RepID=UPI001BA2C336|nr:hypothetical protein [Burkholderia vietnamiensis]MBR8361360.1 hypothetical protein [Burkholderia vietnamiensis]
MKKFQPRGLVSHDESNHETVTRPHGAELAEVTHQFNRNGEAAVAELKRMQDAIQSINKAKARISTDKRAGFVFEEFVAGTYNSAARKAGDFKTTATTGSTGGFGIDPKVDIRVTRGDKLLAEAQAKCCRNVGRTAVSISKPRYNGTQRIVPEGQGKPVVSALERSAKTKATSTNARMRAVGNARQEAASKVSEKLQAGGHQSKGLSHKAAMQMASGDTELVSRMIAVETVSSAATAGMKSGAIFSGALSTLSASRKVIDGELTLSDAAKVIAKETVGGGIQSAVTSVTAEGVKTVCKRTLSSTVANTVARGAGPMAVAGCVWEVAADAYNGTLTPKTAAKSVTKAAGGWAGAELGAIAGTAICPGIGTALGGIVGGLFGAMLGGAW